MAISISKIDKLLQLFSSSEDEELDRVSDEELDRASDEDDKNFQKDLKPCILPFEAVQHFPEDTKDIKICTDKIQNFEDEDLPSDDEIKMVDLVVKPITIYDSDNESKNHLSDNQNALESSEKKKKRQSSARVPTQTGDSDSENEFVEVKRKGRRKHDPVGKRARTRKNRPKVDRNLRCKECNIKMKNEQLFMFHMQIHNGQTETECVICNKDFETLQNLQDHYATYDKLKSDEHFIKLRPFACNLCALRYKSRNYLLDHLDIHAGSKKFLCPICGKQFFKRFSLKVHLKYHQKSYHSCEKCKLDLQFRNPKEYHAHQRIVHGENAFRCEICNREFSRKHDMMKHKDTHGREPNCCIQCNVNFEFRREYNQHMKEVHNRIKKYTCTVCGKVFLMHCKLTRHLETHNKIRENCTLCGKEFRSRRDYNAHMRNMHGVVLDLPKTESKKGTPRKSKVQKNDDNDLVKNEFLEQTKDDSTYEVKPQDFSGYLTKDKNN